jgi:hypothetical protein
MILRHPPIRRSARLDTKELLPWKRDKKEQTSLARKKNSSPTSPVIEIGRVQTLGALVLF